jgi:uncharacterized protein (TIGR00255 family)
MTSFGRSQTKGDWGTAIWEIRSINHRYLEMTIRLPETLREIEQNVREILHNYFKRGKIECTLRFQPGAKLSSLITVNQALVKQLTSVATEIAGTLPSHSANINIMDLLSWNGVIVEENVDLDQVKEQLLDLFRQAAQDLQAGRQREGAILAQGIKERIENIGVLVEGIKKNLPKVIEKQQDKILSRLEDVRSNLDEQRLEQEMIYFTQKIDVSEEIDRTLSHLTEVKRSLAKEEAAGRRLDFMMQELNREANTLASKSADSTITHAAVEMKVLIEQIREQVQNIE